MAAAEGQNPAWVRKCADAFKKDKCKLASEERTLENWRRFNRRMDASPYKQAIKHLCASCDLGSHKSGGKALKCTCSIELATRLPMLAGLSDIPKELLPIGDDENEIETQAALSKKQKSKAVRVKKEPGDDTYYALMGDEGLEPMKISSEDMKREEKEEGAKPDGDQQARTSDAEDGDGEDDGEDMEDADYGAGERYDDDDDLVDDEGGGSDDEAERYGTF